VESGKNWQIFSVETFGGMLGLSALKYQIEASINGLSAVLKP